MVDRSMCKNMKLVAMEDRFMRTAEWLALFHELHTKIQVKLTETDAIISTTVFQHAGLFGLKSH